MRDHDLTMSKCDTDNCDSSGLETGREKKRKRRLNNKKGVVFFLCFFLKD